MYERGDGGLSLLGSPSRFPVLKGCTCYDLGLLRRELISYAVCFLSVVSITLVVMISVYVSGVYVHRDSDFRR